jgi:hypothetical protein
MFPSGIQALPQLWPAGQFDGVGVEQAPICGNPERATHLTSPAPGTESMNVVSPPQQSASCVHRSPWTRQPDAGWQILLFDCPKGAHSELQQLVQPWQTVPSTAHPVGSVAHVPGAAAVAPVHAPVQHSLSWKQMSPGCVQ